MQIKSLDKYIEKLFLTEHVEINKKALELNLKKMGSDRLLEAVYNESMSGNAGENHCAVNFLFNNQDGKIFKFGNNSCDVYSQNVSKGTYLFLINFNPSRLFIDHLILPDELDKSIIHTLAYTAHRWNKEQGVY